MKNVCNNEISRIENSVNLDALIQRESITKQIFLSKNTEIEYN